MAWVRLVVLADVVRSPRHPPLAPAAIRVAVVSSAPARRRTWFAAAILGVRAPPPSMAPPCRRVARRLLRASGPTPPPAPPGRPSSLPPPPSHSGRFAAQARVASDQSCGRVGPSPPPPSSPRSESRSDSSRSDGRHVPPSATPRRVVAQTRQLLRVWRRRGAPTAEPSSGDGQRRQGGSSPTAPGRGGTARNKENGRAAHVYDDALSTGISGHGANAAASPLGGSGYGGSVTGSSAPARASSAGSAHRCDPKSQPNPQPDSSLAIRHQSSKLAAFNLSPSP